MIVLAGLLDPIEGPLTSILEWLHSSIGFTWAWAIVVLTLMVRMVILPLTIKQIRSMQKLQAYAPQIKALQQKYKGDKKRLNEEVMKFYRENKVNPAASCLPIVLQIPIFISLFFVLRDFEDEVFPRYPQSELGWLGLVPDITEPVNAHWSGYLLLVVYVVSQLASTYFMATTMDRNQRYLLFALPFVFVFFIVRFPVGLMIYWATTNLWTVGQGTVTRRLAPKPQPIPKRTSRTAPRPKAAAVAPANPEPVAAKETPRSPTQPRVRRRKKKGPQAGRRR